MWTLPSGPVGHYGEIAIQQASAWITAYTTYNDDIGHQGKVKMGTRTDHRELEPRLRVSWKI